jgi:hypothetical protein
MTFFDSPFRLWALIIATITIGDYLKCCNAQAQEDPTALHLAQCIRAECDECNNEYEKETMAHILVKRMVQYNNNKYNKIKKQSINLDTMILSYCSVFDRRAKAYYGARSTAIRKSTFAKGGHGSLKWWRYMKAWTHNFLEGRIDDPYPLAMHFNGLMDIHRVPSNWIEITRFKHGKRANIIYRYKHAPVKRKIKPSRKGEENEKAISCVIGNGITFGVRVQRIDHSGYQDWLGCSRRDIECRGRRYPSFADQVGIAM